MEYKAELFTKIIQKVSNKDGKAIEIPASNINNYYISGKSVYGSINRFARNILLKVKTVSHSHSLIESRIKDCKICCIRLSISLKVWIAAHWLTGWSVTMHSTVHFNEGVNSQLVLVDWWPVTRLTGITCESGGTRTYGLAFLCLSLYRLSYRSMANHDFPEQVTRLVRVEWIGSMMAPGII